MASISYLGLESVFDRGNRSEFGGKGRLAGDAPLFPLDDDGRARILNVPSRVNITVLESITYVVVARTISRDDGTWEVPYLDQNRVFTVIGADHWRSVNSAIQDWVYPAEME